MTTSHTPTSGSSTPETSSLLALKGLIDRYEAHEIDFDYEVEGALMRLWTVFENDGVCPDEIELEWWEEKKLEYFGEDK